MTDCELFVGGELAINIGIVFLFLASRERFRSRLAESLPLSSCGSLAEGIVQVTGRAVSPRTLTSPERCPVPHRFRQGRAIPSPQ